MRASAYASIRSLFSPLGRPVCIRGVPSPPRCLCRSIWEPFCVHTSATTTVNEKVCGACKDSLSAQGACTHAHLSPATARAWCRRPGDHAAAPAPRAGLPTSRPCRILCACGADASGACGAAGSDATPPPSRSLPSLAWPGLSGRCVQKGAPHSTFASMPRHRSAAAVATGTVAAAAAAAALLSPPSLLLLF